MPGMSRITISIAMATYNGEKYISEQLHSLAKQSHLPMELVVGDDGSTDATVDIVKDFRRRAPFPVHIHRNEVNLGYARNFLTTAKRCQGDWIAFCDQDDVWLPNKLAESALAIQRTPDCNMVLQNAFLCDSELTVRGRRFPGLLAGGVYGQASQYGFWVWPGFLKTIPRGMIDLLSDERLPRSWFAKDGELTHDKWTCLIANALGGIVVLDEPVALYRRHEAALTGQYNRQSFGDAVTKARSVSFDHYEFLSDVADDCADYMHQLGELTKNNLWASAFLNHSSYFRQLANIQRLRGRLHHVPRFSERLLLALNIARKGGYFGRSFVAMGLRSALKDITRIASVS